MALSGFRILGRFARFATTPALRTYNQSYNYAAHVRQYSELIYKDDPDTFGLLSKPDRAFDEKIKSDEGDLEEEKFLQERPLPSSQLSVKQYSNIIKEHLQYKRVKEALDVLEERMIKEDRVQPTNYIYNILIDGCADVGYTKKAFMLFNDMKKRGLKPTGATYTALFNACSNSPWSDDGLKRAIGLRELMKEKLYEPNLTNYNAMIKAFGRCGDLLTAFKVVDEMHSKKIKIRVHTLNFLMQACITDKTNGFRHALFVWRKMLNLRERPNIYTFNLMLRCIKECGIGEGDLEGEIKKLLPNSNQLMLEGRKKSHAIDSQQSDLTISLNNGSNVDQMPNLLAPIPHLGSIVTLNDVKTPRDRFMLIGGLDNFLLEMQRQHEQPDIKTFTQLLDVIPDTLEVEEKLLEAIKNQKVKTDIDFYNLLMRRRCFRSDYDSAKSILQLIEDENKILSKGKFVRGGIIRPNIMTYGVLALTCDSFEKAQELIEKIKNKHIRLNITIMGTLLKNAIIKHDYEYIFYVMNFVRNESISISSKFIEILDKFKSRDFKGKEHDVFRKYCERWLTEVSIDNTEETEHPWTQFRVRQPETFQRSNFKMPGPLPKIRNKTKYAARSKSR